MTNVVKSYMAMRLPKFYGEGDEAAYMYCESSRAYKDMNKAVDEARAEAWKSGRDQAVFELVSVIEKPDVVNTAKVTPVT